MASLSKDKSGNYHVHFRFGGRQFHKSLKTADEKTADATKGRVELTLRDLDLGRLVLPAGADFWQMSRDTPIAARSTSACRPPPYPPATAYV